MVKYIRLKASTFHSSKIGLILKDLHDEICMAGIRVPDFHCVCTFMQVVHIEFVKVVRAEYSALNSLNKMSHEEAISAVIVALISAKKTSQGKRDIKEKPV